MPSNIPHAIDRLTIEHLLETELEQAARISDLEEERDACRYYLCVALDALHEALLRERRLRERLRQRRDSGEHSQARAA